MKIPTPKRLATALILAGLCCHATAAGNWIADANDCKLWDGNPKDKETVTWSGACKDGYAEGPGVLQWIVDGKPSSTFEGSFSAGKRNGKGVEASVSGVRFEGNFVDDHREGKGALTFPDGAHYEGDFLGDRRTGKGAMTFKDGAHYEGDFVNDKLTGKGALTFKSGNRYEGDFVEGKRTGKGIMTFKDGTHYEGDFVNDKLTGKGVFTWADGARYEGDMVDGNPSGKGAIKLASGDRYEGDFVGGKRTGKGVYTWASGDRYEGDFVDGKMVGGGNFSKARQAYAMKDNEGYTGSLIKRDRVHGDLPLDKTYAQLSEAEKNRVKAAYEPMRPGDEPPFPERGLGPLYFAVTKANDKIGEIGLLDMAVTIDSTGAPTKIEVYKSPDHDLTMAAVQIIMLTKFKPAVCNGQPCTMAFPFSMNIVRSL